MNERNYQKVITYLSKPSKERKLGTVSQFCLDNEITPEEYAEIKSNEEYPNDLFAATKRWHLINRSKLLNKYYGQIMSRSNIRPSEMQAYMKLIEFEDDKEGTNNPTYNQFNFLSDLNDQQKQQFRRVIKDRGIDVEQLSGGLG